MAEDEGNVVGPSGAVPRRWPAGSHAHASFAVAVTLPLQMLRRAWPFFSQGEHNVLFVMNGAREVKCFESQLRGGKEAIQVDRTNVIDYPQRIKSAFTARSFYPGKHVFVGF